MQVLLGAEFIATNAARISVSRVILNEYPQRSHFRTTGHGFA